MSKREPKIKEYSVVWLIDVTATDPQDAAQQARAIMRNSNDPEYIANSFGVALFGTKIVDPALTKQRQIVWVDLDKIEGRI